jgi:hypothetical protein
MANAIRRNWQNSAIAESMQLKRKSRRAYRATGVPNYCSSCDSSSKCMRLISDGSPNVIKNLREHLAKFASAPSTSVDTCNAPQSKKSKRYRYMPQFPLSNELMRISGVDLTQIDGVDAMTAQTLITEVGFDVSRWKTESISLPGSGCVRTIASEETRR